MRSIAMAALVVCGIACGSKPAADSRPISQPPPQQQPVTATPRSADTPIIALVRVDAAGDALELSPDWLVEDPPLGAALPSRAASIEEQWTALDGVPQHCYLATFADASKEPLAPLVELLKRRGVNPEPLAYGGTGGGAFGVRTDRLLATAGKVDDETVLFMICWRHPDVDLSKRLAEYQRAIPFLAPLNPLPEILGGAPESIRLARVPDGSWSATITYPISDVALDRAATWFLANGFQGDKDSGWIAKASLQATADVTTSQFHGGRVLELLVMESAPQ